MSENIIIKANEKSPEYISQGNISVEKKDGYYETDNRKFADYILGRKYGVKVKKKAAPKKDGGKK